MFLKKAELREGITIGITGSKSITNRLLILQKLFGNIEMLNASNSQDSQLMAAALNSTAATVNIHHAGTAMRFLSSFFAIQEGRTTVLTGSDRMKQRPMAFLVDALRNLGAHIDYLEKEGFPPLKIKGVGSLQNYVRIPADVSSQFITSLLLIAGKLKNGLQVELTGEITSRPYLEMTLRMLEEVGIKSNFAENIINVFPAEHLKKTVYTVESDWSSASYFYSLAAIGRKNIRLKSLKKDSLQGDSAIAELYENFFGIKSHFLDGTEVLLEPRQQYQKAGSIKTDMNSCPDIAQTLCVTAAALEIPFEITGLATLKVKETDRLVALQNELTKLGCETEITENSIKTVRYGEPFPEISVATYNDHRMAMSFAPYCLIREITIENPEVVEKSYPEFWQDLEQLLIFR